MTTPSTSLPLFRSGMLRECWAFRGFILASVKREFVSRYLGTQLGFFWAVAQPLVLILIYTVVFAQIMRPALPGHASSYAYGVYLCAGMIVWQLFSELVNRSVAVFVHNGNLLKKVNLPKLALPVIVCLSALVNFAVLAALFAGFLVVTGNFPGIASVAMVPVVLLVLVMGVGLGVLLGTINVFYRDVAQSIAIVLQFWFWLTPIVYPAQALPPLLASAIAWNPLAPVVGFAQAVFLDGQVPSWSTLTYPSLVAIVCVALGWIAFRKLSVEIVDEL